MDLDARGLRCPLPIVRLTQAVKKMDIGMEIRVLADDPAFQPDVEAMVPEDWKYPDRHREESRRVRGAHPQGALTWWTCSISPTSPRIGPP